MRRLLFLFIFLVGCSKTKSQEYYVSGEWRKCDYITTEACGQKFNCSGVVYSCQTNVQTRTVD